MRSRMRYLIIIGAVLLIGLATVLAKNADSKEPETPETWEYLVVAGGSVNLESGELNSRKQPDQSFREATVLGRNFDKLGAKGWELVSVYGSPSSPIYYFKRPKEAK
jgi:hypothetical protein